MGDLRRWTTHAGADWPCMVVNCCICVEELFERSLMAESSCLAVWSGRYKAKARREYSHACTQLARGRSRSFTNEKSSMNRMTDSARISLHSESASQSQTRL